MSPGPGTSPAQAVLCKCCPVREWVNPGAEELPECQRQEGIDSRRAGRRRGLGGLRGPGPGLTGAQGLLTCPPDPPPVCLLTRTLLRAVPCSEPSVLAPGWLRLPGTHRPGRILLHRKSLRAWAGSGVGAGPVGSHRQRASGRALPPATPTGTAPHSLGQSGSSWQDGGEGAPPCRGQDTGQQAAAAGTGRLGHFTLGWRPQAGSGTTGQVLKGQLTPWPQGGFWGTTGLFRLP